MVALVLATPLLPVATNIPSLVSLLVNVSVTSWRGALANATLNCALPPASVVLRFTASVNTTPGVVLTAAVEVSTTLTLTLCPPAVKLMLSAPSVSLSANKFTLTLACPDASVLKLPLRLPPSTSPLLIPTPDKL